LRPFDDQQNVGLILRLPEALLKEAKSGRLSSKRSARLVEIALAIELLFAAGLRIKNLAHIHVRDNLQWSRTTRTGICHLVIDRQDVKNGEPIEVELHEDVVRLLNTLLGTYRQTLVQPRSLWLFGTRKDDKAVDPVVLARRITTEIRRRTGLTVNVHLFRALLGKLYLEQNPGGYEVLRRLLGHRSITTTLQAYTGVESVANAKHFDETMRRLKNDNRLMPMRQKRTRQGGRDAA
jgi:integrase